MSDHYEYVNKKLYQFSIFYDVIIVVLSLERYLLKYLIIDCLRYDFHPSHFNLASTLDIIKLFKPKKSILTNLHIDLDYNILKKRLPKNVVPAYDGLSINF